MILLTATAKDMKKSTSAALWILRMLASVLLMGCNLLPSHSFDLHIVGFIPTMGAAGLRHFHVLGRDYIACANFWDGGSPTMHAYSTIQRIKLESKAVDKSMSDELLYSVFPVFSELQAIGSFGAHGLDLFDFHYRAPADIEIGDDDNKLLVLAIPNYYQCQAMAENCYALALYVWDSTGAAFEESLYLQTIGASQSANFRSTYSHYIVVAENFQSKISVHRLGMNPFGAPPSLKSTKIQEVLVAGVAALTMVLIDEAWYMIGASYHDSVGGWSTQSVVFVFDEESEKFRETQRIETYGAHDIEAIHYQNEVFLFFSEDRNSYGPLIDSQLFQWHASAQQFRLFQRIPTDGAHGAKFFLYGSPPSLWLAIANFGDRHEGRLAANSSVWRLQVDEINVESVAMGNSRLLPQTTAEFVLEFSVPTYGATDWESFQLGDANEHKHHFLAVSEEGDFDKVRKGEPGSLQSQIFELLP